MKTRITDIAITKTAAGWQLQIPIESGSLELRLEAGEHPSLDNFLATAALAPTRRFGEDPRNG